MKFNYTSQNFENIHIALWLVKDTCWMLEQRWLGAAVMIPTLYLAFYVVLKTRKTPGFYLNTAIFLWIFANSFWMTVEFFLDNMDYKYFSAIPFSLGIIFVIIYSLNIIRLNNITDEVTADGQTLITK